LGPIKHLHQIYAVNIIVLMKSPSRRGKWAFPTALGLTNCIGQGDKGSILQYLNGIKPEGSLYKNEWQLTPIQKE
jgi:hypothetical protein